MTTPEAEDRLRRGLARYGATLEAAAGRPAPRPRHLVAVDGPVGPRRSPRVPRPGRGALARAAVVLVALGAAAGATWAAVRPPSDPATTATERGWADDDVVRPEDRPSAFAALDGTWPLPEGGSLRFVLDRPTERSTTFAGYRQQLASTASCLWLRAAYEEPDLTADERAEIAAVPGWPGTPTRPADREALQEAVDAALAGDAARLRPRLTADCAGTGTGLGLPEIGPYWLVAGGGRASSAPPPGGGSAVAVDPAAIRGWEDIASRLGPDARVEGGLALPGGGHNVLLSVRGLALSLTIERVDGPVALPVTEAELDRGHDVRGEGVEVWSGPTGDGATLARVVGPTGTSVTLGLDAGPVRTEAALGDLADLAVAVHAAAWPR